MAQAILGNRLAEASMHGRSDCSFGGVAAAGLVVRLKLDDGAVWHFTGRLRSSGSGAGSGYGRDLESNFPGLGHIKGDCTFQVLAGAMGPGGIVFSDLHGTIGTIVGYTFSVGALYGIGAGTWSPEAA